jgi:hypothetical protein
MKQILYTFKKRTQLMILVLVLSFIAPTVFAQSLSDGLRLHYTFKELVDSKVKDLIGENHGTLVNGAYIDDDGEYPHLNLPEEPSTARPYLDMGEEAGEIIAEAADITIAFFMKVPADYLSDFTWNFSNSENIGTDANGHMFFDCVHQKTAITPTHHGGEAGNKIEIGSSVPTDFWFHCAFTLEDFNGYYYIDGVELGTAAFGTLPLDLGATKFNWIGRCAYDGGGDLAGQYNVNPAQIADFRVYDRALSADEVQQLADGQTSSLSLSMSEIKIFVDQKSNQLNIKNAQGAMVNILNMNGQVVLGTKISDNHQLIGVQSLLPGVYLVKANNNGKTSTHKFIKK